MFKGRSRNGNALVEFTLAAIPLLFVQFSMVEMCRAVWDYHSLAQAVKVASRAAAARGAGCAALACALTVDSVAHTIASYAVGMPASSLNVTLTSNAGTVTCNPLNNCYGNSATWPPSGGNTVGTDIVVTGSYAFTSAMSMYVPGKGGSKFSGVTFTAQSRQTILF